MIAYCFIAISYYRTQINGLIMMSWTQKIVCAARIPFLYATLHHEASARF